jgi:O-antigen ligase
VTAAPFLRTRALAGDRLTVILQVVGAIVVGLAAAFVAATMEPLIAVSLAGGIVLVLLSIRWPLLPLFVFVALIPIEETVNIAGFGTLSRWAGIVFAAVYAIGRLGRLTPGALPLAAWAYLGWAVLSMAWAIDPGTTQGQLQTLIQLWIVGFLIADVVIHRPAIVRPLLWAYSASAAATAAIGIAVYLVGGVAAVGRTAAIGGQNPAQFATLLLPALIFALHEVLQGRTVTWAGAVALLCTAAIALSGTRSVWLAAIVVIFSLLLPRLGFRRAVLALVVLGVLIAATFQIPGVADLVAERTETAASTGGAGRTDIWSVGIEIIELSPIIGVGYANFPAAFTSALVRSANVTEAVGTAEGPHSILVGTAGELGVVGFALLALFIVPLIIRRGWGADGLVVQAILASLMVNALFIDILGNRKQVWVAIGLAAGLAYLAKQAHRRDAGTLATLTQLTPNVADPSPPQRDAVPRAAREGIA